tara:strand:- start:2595 stop:5474 length:2880 start_codon:yes stop_codon:yes gene_type:complete
MPYQGSMQTVRFQNREVFDDSDRQFQKARDVEQKESQAIKSFERAATFDVQEKKRQDQVMTANDTLALKQLSQFSKGLDSFLQQGMPAIAQKMATDQAEKDLIDWATNPTGAAKYVEETVTQEQNVQKVDVKNAKIAETIAPVSQTRANEIQNGSVSNRYTTNVLTATEAVNGFPAHLIAEMDTSEKMVIVDGRKFMIKDARNDKERLAVAKLIASEYIVNNNPGFKRSIAATHLAKPILDHMNKELKARTVTGIKIGYNTTIENSKRKLYLASRGELPGITLTDALNTFSQETKRAYEGLNPDGAGLQKMRSDMALMLGKTLREHKGDKAEKLKEIQAAIDATDLRGIHPGAGKDKKSWSDLYPELFGKDALYSTMRKAEIAEYQAEISVQNGRARTFGAELDLEVFEHLKSGGDIKDLNINERIAAQLRANPYATEYLVKLQGKSWTIKGYDDSMQVLRDLDETFAGFIPEAIIRKQGLDSRAVEDYHKENGSQTVDKVLGSATPEKTKELWAAVTTGVKREFKIGSLPGENAWDSNTILFRNKVISEVRIRARALIAESGGTLGELEALNQAWGGKGGVQEEITAGVLDPNSKWYRNPISGEFEGLGASGIPATQLEKQVTMSNFLTSLDKWDGKGPLSESALFLHKNEWLEPYKGRVGTVHPFARRLAILADEDPLTFVNNQREKILEFKGKPLEPTPGNDLVGKLFTSPELITLRRLNGGNSRLVARVVDQKVEKFTGKPSVTTIVASLGKMHEGQTAAYGLPYSQLKDISWVLDNAGIEMPTEAEYNSDKNLQKKIATAFATERLDDTWGEMLSTPSASLEPMSLEEHEQRGPEIYNVNGKTWKNPNFIPIGSDEGVTKFGDYLIDLDDGKGPQWVRPPKIKWDHENTLFGDPNKQPALVLRRFYAGWYGGYDNRGNWADQTKYNVRGQEVGSQLQYGNTALMNYTLLHKGGQ